MTATARPRSSTDLLAVLAQRLTARDRHILRMLFEHRVLTTTQITDLAFGSYTTAAHRMAALYRLRACDRFRPFLPAGGSAPWHYILDAPGADVLAAEDGITNAQLGYRHDRAISIAHSRQLAHTLGVNTFFTTLAACARTDRTCALLTWMSERRCGQHWGDLVRPDAYGKWSDGPATSDFFLEYDTGTETLDRVTAKLDHYQNLANTTGLTTLVLFYFPTHRREAAFRNRAQNPPVPAATAAAKSPIGSVHPASAIWLPLGRPGPRRRLAAVAYPLTGNPRPNSAAP